MPIVRKVPVVHKFGIISHSHRADLLERLMKQAQSTSETNQCITSDRKTVEVLEAFVNKFNSCERTSETRHQLELNAHKIIERLKRKSGLRESGVSSHVDLPSAWTELAMLSQCKGPIKDECLDILVTSLDQAPIDETHVAVLFYLAEMTLYWLRTESVHGAYLTCSELKLLGMGRLVFIRLYYHQLAGELQETDSMELKQRLQTYLDGFGDCEALYDHYPDALLCVRCICHVGKILVETHDSAQKEPEQDLRAAASACEMSPALFLSLDVWRCVHDNPDGLAAAINAVRSNAFHFNSSDWFGALCALEVLADVAVINRSVLFLLQSLASGTYQTCSPEHDPGSCTSTVSGRSMVLGHGDGMTMERGDSTAADVAGVDDVDKSEECCGDVVSPALCDFRVPSSKSDAIHTSPVDPCRPNPDEKADGLCSWRWELALGFVEALTNVCLRGMTSGIQKSALVGSNRELRSYRRRQTDRRSSMTSCGLMDLLYLPAACGSTDDGPGDWSWRVQYAAVQGLQKVSQQTARVPPMEGMQVVAWRALQDSRAHENDLRVLEAYKISQMDSEGRYPLMLGAVGGRLAAGLGKLYLPSLPPPAILTPRIRREQVVKPLLVAVSADKPMLEASPSTRRSMPTAAASERTPQRKPLRTSINDEIRLSNAVHKPLPSSLNNTMLQLRQIVDKQWRKELEEQLKLDREILEHKRLDLENVNVR